MKYKETGFRAIYGNLCVFPKCKAVEGILRGFPGENEADCILTYGYIDHEAGLSLEILALGIQEGNSFTFFDGNDEVSSKIRIGAVDEEEFYFLNAEDLKERYADKISMLDGYMESEDIEKSREMKFLDGSRDPSYIDDILVYLVKEGLKPESCWARICGLGDHCIIGILLNEPDQDFGYHIGEKIGIFVQKPRIRKSYAIPT